MVGGLVTVLDAWHGQALSNAISLTLVSQADINNLSSVRNGIEHEKHITAPTLV